MMMKHPLHGVATCIRGKIALLHQVKMIKITESRFRNPLHFLLVLRESEKCIDCGTCGVVCKAGVHIRVEGYNRMEQPRSQLCPGANCTDYTEGRCYEQCPMGAISITKNEELDALGDARWTPDLILSTWESARTGQLPEDEPRFHIGASGGGFDKISFNFPATPPDIDENDIDLSIMLNKRSGPKISIPGPIYGGGMSYGSISKNVMLARAKAAKILKTFISTGEGGYPDELIPYKNNAITQIATGLFGVREETIKRAPIIEFNRTCQINY